MSDFSRSSTGRLMALSFGIALTGSGIATVVGLPASTVLMSASLFVPITLNIVGLAMALEEHWFGAVLGAILLPVALVAYTIGVNVLATYRPSAGYMLVALGLGALGLALRARKHEATSPLQMAEQH
jgi:hypothetical protein